MNLVMSEVLPTLCSPKNTSLNFRSGLPKSPEVDIVSGVGRMGGSKRVEVGQRDLWLPRSSAGTEEQRVVTAAGLDIVHTRKDM